MQKKPFAFFICLAFLMLSTLGCGPRELPFTDNSKDSVAFALSMKGLVLNTTENIKSVKEPADALREIVAALSELDVCPTGEHLKTYQEIHTLAKALMNDCEKGKPAGFDGRIKEIADVAKKLPGDPKIEKEKTRD